MQFNSHYHYSMSAIILCNVTVYIFLSGWKATGSLNLARTKDRMLYYKRSMNTAKYVDIIYR